MSHKPQAVESSAKVPTYIVTFSDMVTLLLTFFVMLLSLATVQDPELFNIGRDAFWSSVTHCGLGMLPRRSVKPEFGEIKIKYFIPESDEQFEFRIIDAKEEEIRRIFRKIRRSMTTMSSQITAKTVNFSVTNISFSPGGASLNESAKNFLTQFVLDLQDDPDSNAIKLCVLGLASDESTEKKRWMLSASRAQAVADFLNDILASSDLAWPVFSWGAGSGGYWVDRDSPISEQSQILIAVLRSNN